MRRLDLGKSYARNSASTVIGSFPVRPDPVLVKLRPHRSHRLRRFVTPGRRAIPALRCAARRSGDAGK